MLPRADTGHGLDGPYLSLLNDIEFLPIFILGLHRSGTTLLYKLLADMHCFNVVSAYHLIRYDELLSNYLHGKDGFVREELSDYFKSLGLMDRIIDRVMVTPDLPEEYGFRLLKVGGQSHINRHNVEGFIELCRKVQFVSMPDRPLLLKNPWDFENFIYVKSRFPNARFIFIHRHPLHVLCSQLRTVRLVLANKSPYMALIDPHYARLFQGHLRLFTRRLLFSSQLGLRLNTCHLVRAIGYFVGHVGLLPNEDYISIRYEDLCHDPDTCLERVLRFLGLNDRPSVKRNELIEPRPVHLLPEVARRADRLRRRLRSYYAHQGYD